MISKEAKMLYTSELCGENLIADAQYIYNTFVGQVLLSTIKWRIEKDKQLQVIGQGIPKCIIFLSLDSCHSACFL